MEKAKILEQLIKEKGYSLKSFAEKCGIPYTTLYTMLKNGVGKASVNTVITVCKNLGITVEQMEAMAEGNSEQSYEPTYEDIQSLIARNGKRLTLEQKQDIIRTLLSDE